MRKGKSWTTGTVGFIGWVILLAIGCGILRTAAPAAAHEGNMPGPLEGLKQSIGRWMMGVPETPPSPFREETYVSPHSPLVNEVMRAMPSALKPYTNRTFFTDLDNTLQGKLLGWLEGSGLSGLAHPSAPGPEINIKELESAERQAAPGPLAETMGHEGQHFRQFATGDPGRALAALESLSKPHSMRTAEKEANWVGQGIHRRMFEDYYQKALDRAKSSVAGRFPDDVGR